MARYAVRWAVRWRDMQHDGWCVGAVGGKEAPSLIRLTRPTPPGSIRPVAKPYHLTLNRQGWRSHPGTRASPKATRHTIVMRFGLTTGYATVSVDSAPCQHTVQHSIETVPYYSGMTVLDK